MTEKRTIVFDGHRLSYRVAGSGPALVVPFLWRHRDDCIQMRTLARSHEVFQIEPIGYGYSDRVPGYAGEAVTAQVLSVLDAHGVDRFALWGHSAAALMSAFVARATPRTTALIMNGVPLIDWPTPALYRQMERRSPPGHRDRTFWSWHASFDWGAELAHMDFPKLLYFGTEDHRACIGAWNTRNQLKRCNVEVLEFPGHDHSSSGSSQEVTRAVGDWLYRATATANSSDSTVSNDPV